MLKAKKVIVKKGRLSGFTFTPDKKPVNVKEDGTIIGVYSAQDKGPRCRVVVYPVQGEITEKQIEDSVVDLFLRVIPSTISWNEKEGYKDQHGNKLLYSTDRGCFETEKDLDDLPNQDINDSANQKAEDSKADAES